MAAAQSPWSRVVQHAETHPWLLPLAIFAAATVTYIVLAGDRLGPTLIPDEFRYGNLAESIASGDGSTWRGTSVGVNTIYPYVIAPAWFSGDGVGAYNAAKAINVVLLTAMVWPVWLVAKDLAGPKLAALAAILVLFGMWMESSARLMTEALALPAATLALCSTVLYLRRAHFGWLLAALAGCGVAAATRSQLAILVPVLATAMTIDVLRRPKGERRDALDRVRAGLVVVSCTTAVLAIVVAFARTDALADNAGFFDLRPNVWQAAGWAVDHASALTAMVGVVPWLISVSLLGSRSAWRDERTGPFLAVLAAALPALILLAGWYSDTVAHRPVERYVFYLGPLLVIGMVAGLRFVTWRGVAVATVVTTLLLGLSHHPSRFGSETQSLFGAAKTLGLVDSLKDDFMWQLAAVAAVIGIAVAAAIWLRDRSATVTIGADEIATTTVALGLCVVIAAVGMFFVSKDQWQLSNTGAAKLAAPFGGKAPDKVDKATAGAKTLVASEVPPYYALWLEFFNKEIDRVAVRLTTRKTLNDYGPACDFRPRSDGTFLGGRNCGDDHKIFVTAMYPASRPTLIGQNRFVSDLDPLGLVSVSSGQPRFVALRTELCPPPAMACQPATIQTWNERRGTLELGFAGGVNDFDVEVDQDIYTLPANRPTQIKVPLERGERKTVLRPSWPDERPGVPVLQTLRLRAGTGPATPLN